MNLLEFKVFALNIKIVQKKNEGYLIDVYQPIKQILYNTDDNFLTHHMQEYNSLRIYASSTNIQNQTI